MGSYTCVRQPVSLWSSNLEAMTCFFKKKKTQKLNGKPPKEHLSTLCLHYCPCGQPVLEDSAFKDTKLHKVLPPEMPGVLTTLSRIHHWDPVTFSADKIGNDENRGAEEPSGGKLSLGEGNWHSACMWQQSLHHPSTNTTPCSLLYLSAVLPMALSLKPTEQEERIHKGKGVPSPRPNILFTLQYMDPIWP